MSKSTTYVTADVVRAWAVENPNLAGPVRSGEGTRGRLTRKSIEAFEAANKGQKYRTGAKTPATKVEVKGKNQNGRTVTRKVVPAQVRAWGLTQPDVKVSPQGAIPKAAFLAYLAAGCPTVEA